MKRIRSSIAQLSRQGIGWSSQPTENCHPSFRSVPSPIYPVRTRFPLLREAGKVAEGRMGVRKAGTARIRFAVAVVQLSLGRGSGPYPIRRCREKTFSRQGFEDVLCLFTCCRPEGAL